MGDEIEAVTETAKAVQEVAKTGRALIEPGTDLAKYVARILGTVPEDVIGLLIGDPLHELRQHTLTGILRAAFEKLHRRGIKTAKPVRPGPGKEAFEAASLETDETLQDMWAELLANAMDPNKDTSLQRVFIDTLKQVEPIDALVLQTVLGATFELDPFSRKQLANHLDLRRTQVAVSCDRLARLGVLGAEKVGAGGMLRYTVEAFGVELHRACNPDTPD